MMSIVYDNKLHLAPIGLTLQSILDLGTGSGIWCIEMGDLYPSAEVTGVDLSANMPNWVPPNVHFEVGVNLLLASPGSGRYRGTLDLQSPIGLHPREIPGQCDIRLAKTSAPMFRVGNCPRSYRSILWRVTYRGSSGMSNPEGGRVRRF
jgi:hypothetical protein